MFFVKCFIKKYLSCLEFTFVEEKNNFIFANSIAKMSKQFFKNISKLHSILKPGLQSPKFTKCNKINLFYFDVRSYSTEKAATAAKFVASHASPQSAFRCSVNNPVYLNISLLFS
jgi:hypothetical protein